LILSQNFTVDIKPSSEELAAVWFRN